MSELYIPSQQLKPFYSYVDKTFQGELSDGSHTSLCDIIFIK